MTAPFTPYPAPLMTADADVRYVNTEELTPVWTALGLAGTWTAAAGHLAPSYRKVGDEVQLRGHASNATNQATITTLPAGFRPTANIQFSVWGSANGGAVRAMFRVDLSAAGVLAQVLAPYGYPSGTTNAAPTSWDHIELNNVRFWTS